jgi:hypothetical protein
MTSEEAKALLAATRPDDERFASAAEDGEVRAAFALLREDSSLETWYRRECDLDEAIGARLREALVAPPESLRESLLAGMAAAQSRGPAIHSGPGRIPLRAWAAVAAGIVVLGGVGLSLQEGWFERKAVTEQPSSLLQREEAEFVSFRKSMSDYASGKIQLSIKDEDTVALTNWVSEHSGPVFGSLPEKMNALRGIGCTVIDWDGQKVSLFCFRNTASGHVAHLFVIGREAFQNLPHNDALRKPEICCGLESVAWNDQDQVYLLVAHAPDMSVTEFF